MKRFNEKMDLTGFARKQVFSAIVLRRLLDCPRNFMTYHIINDREYFRLFKINLEIEHVQNGISSDVENL